MARKEIVRLDAGLTAVVVQESNATTGRPMLLWKRKLRRIVCKALDSISRICEEAFSSQAWNDPGGRREKSEAGQAPLRSPCPHTREPHDSRRRTGRRSPRTSRWMMSMGHIPACLARCDRFQGLMPRMKSILRERIPDPTGPTTDQLAMTEGPTAKLTRRSNAYRKHSGLGMCRPFPETASDRSALHQRSTGPLGTGMAWRRTAGGSSEKQGCMTPGR